MTTQVEVVYPSTSAFSGSGQLDLGPFFVPSVKKLLRVELHGQMNFQGILFGPSGVVANFQLYAVQWVPHGSSPANIVTTADGPHWLIRRQISKDGDNLTWGSTSTNANSIDSYGIDGWWAGQQAINADIDLYLSARPPTGVSINNQNWFASLRFWWV